jgi:hypothetical protein
VIVVREALALVIRKERKTPVFASGTVYKSVSVAAEGIRFFRKYLFAMSTPTRKRIALSQWRMASQAESD